jgi:hypothetical protein
MRQWKYTLKNSKALRNAINNENYLEILKELIKSYKQIVKIEIKDGIISMSEEENTLNDYISDIQNYIDYELMDIENINQEDDINYFLNDLYDLCDNLNIWISL